jgi:hypothetical protein
MARRTSPPRADYRLLVTPRYDDRRRIWTTLFVLQTTRVFSTFRYDLSADMSVQGRTIAIRVLGLSTPDLSLPAAGSAEFRREVDGLRGTFAVSVSGLDGRTGTVSVRLAEKSARIVTQPDQEVLIATTDPAHAAPL